MSSQKLHNSHVEGDWVTACEFKAWQNRGTSTRTLNLCTKLVYASKKDSHVYSQVQASIQENYFSAT